MAYEYIEENGTSDPVFIAYFGADQASSTTQSDVFDVCPDYPGGSAFLIAP
jgi:hypothetical protein